VREIRCGKKAIDASSLAEYQIASFFMYSSAACSPARTSAGFGPARIAMISPDSKPDAVARTGVKGAGVGDFHVGHLGRFVDGNVGRVVVVRGDQADGALFRAQAQLRGEVAIHVGDQADGERCGVDWV
jgi:hypothetical protein